MFYVKNKNQIDENIDKTSIKIDEIELNNFDMDQLDNDNNDNNDNLMTGNANTYYYSDIIFGVLDDYILCIGRFSMNVILSLLTSVRWAKA